MLGACGRSEAERGRGGSCFSSSFFHGWMDGLMDRWMVRGRLAPSVRPVFPASSSSYPSFPSFSSSCSLAGYLERVSAAERSEAVAVPFFSLVWLDTSWDVFWRGGILDPILNAFLKLWSNIGVFLHACCQVFLMIFWSESGRMEFEQQAFGMEECAKTNLSRMSGFCRLYDIFSMFFVGLGTNFRDFWCSGNTLRI